MAIATWQTRPPFGASDLKSRIFERYQKRNAEFIRDGQIICCINGCEQWLVRRQRDRKDFTFCPEHHISLSQSTYVHKTATQNLIIHPELFLTIRKTENRLTNEN